MDPEPADVPSRTPSSPPEPMRMERSLSSESGSDSSLSTVYFTKTFSQSGSVPSSRGRSPVASSSGSPADRDGAERLSWPSPSFGAAGGPVDEEDRLSSSKKISSPSSKVEKKTEKTTVTTSEKNSKFEYYVKDGTKGVIKDDSETISVMSGDSEEEDNRDLVEYGDDRNAWSRTCCGCCRACCRAYCSRLCSPADCAGDMLSLVCCPFSPLHLFLKCMCCRCPKMLSSKTKEKARNLNVRVKAPQIRRRRREKSKTKKGGDSKEESDLEEPEANHEDAVKKVKDKLSKKKTPDHEDKSKDGKGGKKDGKGGKKDGKEGKKSPDHDDESKDAEESKETGDHDDESKDAPRSTEKIPGDHDDDPKAAQSTDSPRNPSDPNKDQQSEDIEDKMEKMEMAPGFDDVHRNHFFPSPGVDDDRPGGEKAGGR